MNRRKSTAVLATALLLSAVVVWGVTSGKKRLAAPTPVLHTDKPASAVESEWPIAERDDGIALARDHDTTQALHAPASERPAGASDLSDVLDAPGYSEDQLAKALAGVEAGNIESAGVVSDHLAICGKVVRDPDRMARLLAQRASALRDSWARAPEAGRQPAGDLEARIVEADERALADYQSCLPVWRAMDGDYRKRLEAMAMNGNVAARYLYAKWRPGAMDQPRGFDELQAWSDLALKFSFANLWEGEQLGYQVFAEAYHSGDLFLPRVPFFTLAFSLAQVQCGFAHGSPDEELTLRQLHEFRAWLIEPGFVLDEVSAHSERLQQFCRNPNRLSLQDLTALANEFAP